MVRHYDFAFCDGTLTPNVVWFIVKVGTSLRDRAALRFLRGITSASSRFFFTLHSLEVANFKSAVAASFGYSSTLLLRQRVVSITWLVAFLRRTPACLLNSMQYELH